MAKIERTIWSHCPSMKRKKQRGRNKNKKETAFWRDRWTNEKKWNRTEPTLKNGTSGCPGEAGSFVRIFERQKIKFKSLNIVVFVVVVGSDGNDDDADDDGICVHFHLKLHCQSCELALTNIVFIFRKNIKALFLDSCFAKTKWKKHFVIIFLRGEKILLDHFKSLSFRFLVPNGMEYLSNKQ